MLVQGKVLLWMLVSGPVSGPGPALCSVASPSIVPTLASNKTAHNWDVRGFWPVDSDPGRKAHFEKLQLFMASSVQVIVVKSWTDWNV